MAPWARFAGARSLIRAPLYLRPCPATPNTPGDKKEPSGKNRYKFLLRGTFRAFFWGTDNAMRAVAHWNSCMPPLEEPVLSLGAKSLRPCVRHNLKRGHFSNESKKSVSHDTTLLLGQAVFRCARCIACQLHGAGSAPPTKTCPCRSCSCGSDGAFGRKSPARERTCGELGPSLSFRLARRAVARGLIPGSLPDKVAPSASAS